MQDYLYWTDWPSESVKRYSKFGQKDEQVKAIALNLRSPMDVHVYHPYRQPKCECPLLFCTASC